MTTTRSEVGQRVEARHLLVRANREPLGLRGIALQLRALDDVWVMSVAFASLATGTDTATVEYQRRADGSTLTVVTGGDLMRPNRISLEKRSPMVVGLGWDDVLKGTIGTVSAGLLLHFLRHPSAIGSFLPDVVTGWRRGWDAAEDSRRMRRVNELLDRERGQDRTEASSQVTLAAEIDRAALSLERLQPEVLEWEGIEEIDLDHPLS